MSFFLLILNFFFADIKTVILSLVFGYILFYLAKLCLQVIRLPPGPIPLPVIGNILLFRTPEHCDHVLIDCYKKYGSVFTFWFANIPTVFIADIDLARQAFNKNEFSGKQQSYLASYLSNDKFQDVLFTDFGKTWTALRRVAHMALQKSSTNDKLVDLICASVDQTTKLMIEREGLNKEFGPNVYISYLFINVMATNAFGKSYSYDDKEFKLFHYMDHEFFKEVGASRFALWELSSLFRLLDWRMVKKQRKLFVELCDIVTEQFESHVKDYNESTEKDFIDSLITAKNVALREGKESATHLKDANLVATVMDLFIAGSDTTKFTFQWLIQFMVFYPQTQQKLIQEIENEIGDRIPTHADRNRCHYVMAFISEVLRLRNVGCTGLPHRVTVDSNIGEHRVPKDCIVFVHQGIILTDGKHWPNTQEFRPERFLEDGKYMSARPKAYIPFGVGRRVCIGERLAITNLFLALVRFLQSTNDYDIVLGTNKGIGLDPDLSHFPAPYDNKIIFRPRSGHN